MFPSFSSLPAALQLRVVQKLDTISYTRFRRTNYGADEFCSMFRTFIRIRLRKNARLYLLDSYEDLIAFGNLPQKGVEIQGIQALVDYATKRDDSNLKLPMISENVSVLQKSIEGFYFNEIVVWNCKHYMTLEQDETFHQALSWFLSAIQGLRCPWITVRNVNRRSLEELRANLRPSSLTLSKIALTEEDQRLAEKMTYEIYLDFIEKPLEAVDLVKMCKNKKIVSLQNVEGLFPEVFWNVFENFMKSWKTRSIPLQEGLLIFGEQGHFMDENLANPTSRFSRLGAFHLGAYFPRNIQHLSQRRIGFLTMLKYDYFLVPCEDNKWVVFYLRRSRSDSSYTTVRMGFSNLTRRPQSMEEYLAKIAKHLYKFTVLDYSSLREALEKATTVEQKKTAFSDFVENITNFYTPPIEEL